MRSCSSCIWACTFFCRNSICSASLTLLDGPVAGLVAGWVPGAAKQSGAQSSAPTQRIMGNVRRLGDAHCFIADLIR